MSNPQDFKAETLQVGNISRAIRESSDGDLIFKDDFVPEGVSLKRLVDNAGKIEDFETTINSLSGIDDISVLVDKVDTLEIRVDDNDLNISDIQSNISNLNTSISSISGDYVKKESDLSGIGDSQLKVNSSGNIERHDYLPIIGGNIVLNTTDFMYQINDVNLKATSNPICTILAPMSGAAIYSHSIVERSNGSFKIELSGVPNISGYSLNWLSF
jgi:hypothetical protein